MTKQTDIREVAARNPGVDVRRIEQLIAYRAFLDSVGMSVKPDYRISPSLDPFRNRPNGLHPAKGLRLRVL